MYKRIILIKALIAFVVFFHCGMATSQQRITEQQVDQVFTTWNKPDNPGASIAVVQNGKVIFKKGYGMASLEYNISAGPSTVYQIASASKQVTAFALLLLESQGKLSLSDDVRKYIPELADFGKVITLRHLLLHTSGLRDYWALLQMAGWRYDDIITKNQLLNMIFSQKGLNNQPGYEYVYSNTGYMILGEVVSRVSGMSLSDFTRDYIFKPLKMNNTLFLDNNEKVVRNLAGSYYMSSDGWKKSLLNHQITGSTNLLTTVEDMSLWALNFENPVVGDRNLIRKMVTRGTLDTGDSLDYAMGLETGDYKGLKLIGHRGAERGYRSLFVRFPEQRLAIIVLSNNGSIDPTDLGLKVADIILKDKFVTEGAAVTADQTTTSPAEYKGDPEIIRLCEGRYELRPGFIISITSESSSLFAEAHEVPRTRLVRTAESEFLLPLMRAKLTFAADTATVINKLIVELNGQKMVAPRLKPFDVSSVSPGEYTGHFFSPELSTVYTFVNSGGNLMVKQPRIGDFTLTATETDQFSSDKSFCNRIEFIRDGNRNITGCLLSAGRIRNIKFNKID